MLSTRKTPNFSKKKEKERPPRRISSHFWQVGAYRIDSDAEKRRVSKNTENGQNSHLILKDDDILQAHDLYGCQVFASLRLRTSLVSRYQEQRGIHDLHVRHATASSEPTREHQEKRRRT